MPLFDLDIFIIVDHGILIGKKGLTVLRFPSFQAEIFFAKKCTKVLSIGDRFRHKNGEIAEVVNFDAAGALVEFACA